MTTTDQVSTQTIALPDGRRIAVDLRGPAGGTPVVLLHVAPGSRLLDPDPAATGAAGVRLITLDRPGYGGSDPLPEGTVPTLNGIADDLAYALRAIGVRAAGTAGWSAGGRVALALAARHPDLVSRVALVAAPAPDDEVPWIPAEHRATLHSLRTRPEAALPALTAAFDGQDALEGDAALALICGGPADEALLRSDPAARERLLAMLAEGFRGGSHGTAADVTAANVPPAGLDPAAVRQPVSIFAGEADPVVGPEHADWWASVLPRATVRVLPDAGHLVLVTAWAEILETLVPS